MIWGGVRILLPVCRLSPLLSIKLVQTLMKVKRSGGKPFRAESRCMPRQGFIVYKNMYVPFPFLSPHYIYNLSENLDKILTVLDSIRIKNKDTRNNTKY